MVQVVYYDITYSWVFFHLLCVVCHLMKHIFASASLTHYTIQWFIGLPLSPTLASKTCDCMYIF